MARITLRQLLDHAAERGYGVPAFNINNMEQGLAIMEAAAAVDAPVIMQASRGARSYANDIMLSRMIDALEEMYPQIPLCMLTPRPPQIMTTTSISPAVWSRWRTGSVLRWKASWGCSARSNVAAANRKMATASKARSATISC